MSHIQKNDLTQTYYLIFAGVLLLIAFALRIYLLGDANFNWDEGYTYWIIHLPFGEMLQTTAGDVHPPLYYILLR